MYRVYQWTSMNYAKLVGEFDNREEAIAAARVANDSWQEESFGRVYVEHDDHWFYPCG